MIVSGLTTQTDIKNIASMTAREVMVLGDSKEIITVATTAAQTNNIVNVNFITKLSTGNTRLSVAIPRRAVVSYTLQNYSAPQNKIVQLGTGVATGALVVPTEGDVEFLVKNLSYIHGIATQRITYSDYKKSWETAEVFVDRVVAGLNQANALQATSFFTAVKLGTGANLGIQFTTANEHVDFYVGVSGILSGNPITVTQQAKVSTGKGDDIVRLEKLDSRNLGYQGYECNADLYYKQTPEALVSENYNIVTLNWNAQGGMPASSPSVRTPNSIQFAFPAAADPSAFLTVLSKLFTTAYDATGGVVELPVDANEIDGADGDIV